LLGKKVRLLISALLLAWLAWHTDWGQVGGAFGRLRLEWWLAAFGLYAVTQVLSALRWQLLSRPLGFGQSLRQFTGYYYVGMFFNLFLPTSVGGDVVRAWYLDGGSGRRLAAFLSAFVDRFSGLLVLIALACVALPFCPARVPSQVAWSVWGSGGCALLGLLLLPALTRWTGRFSRVRRLSEAARVYLHHPGILLVSTGLSLLIQLANVLVVWLVGAGMNVPVPLTYYCIAVPMVTLLTLIPVSLNGMGVREWGMVLFLAPLGVGKGTALSLSFLWFLVFSGAGLCGGGVYLFGYFPRPQVQPDHEPVRGDSDQGRAGQPQAAA
jgi:uncharacterized membrane protein YbhN (UPF0104 family)